MSICRMAAYKLGLDERDKRTELRRRIKDTSSRLAGGEGGRDKKTSSTSSILSRNRGRVGGEANRGNTPPPVVVRLKQH